MIHLTQRRLMVESEMTIRYRASQGDAIMRSVCGQLLSVPARYLLWRVRHSQRMLMVAKQKHRKEQLLALREFHLQQIHRTALVRYMGKHGVVGKARDVTLQAFYGVMDPRRAAVMEHKNYLISASSQLCAHDLLELVGDDRGLDLIKDYQDAYGQFFAMFCDNFRAVRNQTPYLLRALIPETKTEANLLRKRILRGDLLPSLSVAINWGNAHQARRRASDLSRGYTQRQPVDMSSLNVCAQ